MDTRHALVDTALGEVTIVASGHAIVGLYFPQHWYPPADDSIGPRVDASDDSLLHAAWQQVTEYLAGRRTSFELPVELTGNAFQQKVWAMLQELPFGHTTTYGELAERLGDKALAQLVGQAVGHNPVSVIVPCHRVVGKDGRLTGYAGGLARKRALLDLEEPSPAEAGRLF